MRIHIKLLVVGDDNRGLFIIADRPDISLLGTLQIWADIFSVDSQIMLLGK